MQNKKIIEHHLDSIRGMMDKMNSMEKEIFSDRLLAWLLFTPKHQLSAGKSKNDLSDGVLTKEQFQIINEISRLTSELKRKLKDND